jgi:F-type H+-transporting ATPase subunit b
MNLTFTIVVQAIVFALLIWVVAHWIWPWMLDKIEIRQKIIADGLAQAERGKASLADAQRQTEGLLKDARDRAHELMAQAEKSANQRVEDAKAQAKIEADRILAGAQAQIGQEVQAAKAQLREQVAALAVAGAERILRREVDAKAHADMLNQLKAQI